MRHLLAVLPRAVVVVVDGRLRRASISGDTVGPFVPLDAATGTGSTRFVASDGQNGLLFGCGTALCRSPVDDRPAVMGTAMGLPADEWQAALRTDDGTLWVRSLTRLAWLRKGAAAFSVAVVPGTHAGYVAAHAAELELFDDRQGGVLTQGDDGYLRWDGTSWHAATHHAGGVPNTMILAFQLSRDGSLWLGSLGHGAFRSQGLGRWEHWTREDGLSADVVWSMARAGGGPLWLATDGGTAPLDRSARPVPNTSYVSAFTRRGRLWTAPFGGPLLRLDPNNGTTASAPSIGMVKGAAVDPENRLWLATADAVFMLPDADAEPAAIRVDRIGAISGVLDFIDGPKGTTWIASPDGVFRWGSGTGLERVLGPGAVSGAPFGGAFRSGTELWLATQTAGILRFVRRGDGLEPLPPVAEPQIASKDLLLLHRDRRGRIWVGTDRGVDMFDGRDWQRFTSAQGPISNDLSQEAVFEDADGSMWFGTSHGLSHLLGTDHLPPPPMPHSPLLTGLALGTEQVRPAREVSVSWVPGSLEIRFDDLNYALGPAMRFRYRMVGIDNGWNETDARVIRYAAPPPGNLFFTLVAFDPVHRTSSAAVRLELHILAPWWRRPLFRCSVLLAVAFCGVAAWRRRVRVLLRRQAREASYRHSIREQQRLEEMVA
ncbi:MAG: hypothetical protein INR65_21160, partial [Gluconacetobacter diazotrophicus]|nr:hypothetical protein [Gluconacetobacter diazotrophicus]